MKRNIAIVMSFMAILFSCKNEDDELNPGQAILGIYQKTDRDLSDELDFVRRIELKQGQQVVAQGTVKNKGESATLGFQYYYEGTYKLEGKVVVINFTKTFHLTDPDISYLPKDELPEVSREFFFEDRYKVSDDYQELIYICPPNALCVPPTPFEKIN
ncbi:hypothetical protein JYB62_03110 [Algoriphagus lutimaris]|uniref:hypothetical protein n=1 Tax=Algoriphagus lutimaris TaxID=613197 RepID=UPI00196AC877|nr:hypothetical protein [Algoriphagus lutimaris]MBN3518979.1 hypothetical protein [Algoriphagus lutimaris]